MYTLRQINSSGLESNLCLGNHYSVIHKERNPKEFKEALQLNRDYEESKVFAFVQYDGDIDLWPLYSGFSYYIMTDSGKTFDCIKP